MVLADLIEAFGHGFGDRNLAGALGAEHRKGNGGVAVEAREGLLLLIGVRDCAEFGELYETAIGERDGGVGKLGDVAGVAERADRLFVTANLAAAGAKVDIGAAQLAVHFACGDAVGVELFGAERNAHFAVGAAVTVDLADAGLALQRTLDGVIHEPGKFFQRHVGRGDGKGLDCLAFHVDLADNRHFDVGWQIAADLVDSVLDVLNRLFRRLFDAEDDCCQGLSVGDGRLDFVDAANGGDSVFDLLRHLHFQLGRRSAALGHGDGNDGNVDIRKTGDRQGVEGLDAEEHQKREAEKRRNRVTD